MTQRNPWVLSAILGLALVACGGVKKTAGGGSGGGDAGGGTAGTGGGSSTDKTGEEGNDDGKGKTEVSTDLPAIALKGTAEDGKYNGIYAVKVTVTSIKCSDPKVEELKKKQTTAEVELDCKNEKGNLACVDTDEIKYNGKIDEDGSFELIDEVKQEGDEAKLEGKEYAKGKLSPDQKTTGEAISVIKVTTSDLEGTCRTELKLEFQPKE